MPDQFVTGMSEASSAHWDACIMAAQQGDRDALGEVFERLRAYLRACANEQLDQQLRVKVSPSDVVQETLLEAHRGLATFRGTTRAELVLWMKGILNHRVQTAYRKFRGTGKRSLARETSISDQSGSRHQPTFTTASSSSPSGHAIAKEELIRLERALKELPPRYEQVIRLRNELKLSFVEVGTALDCSDDAAQKLWTRAINQLALKMQDDSNGR